MRAYKTTCLQMMQILTMLFLSQVFDIICVVVTIYFREFVTVFSRVFQYLVIFFKIAFELGLLPSILSIKDKVHFIDKIKEMSHSLACMSLFMASCSGSHLELRNTNKHLLRTHTMQPKGSYPSMCYPLPYTSI